MRVKLTASLMLALSLLLAVVPAVQWLSPPQNWVATRPRLDMTQYLVYDTSPNLLDEARPVESALDVQRMQAALALPLPTNVIYETAHWVWFADPTIYQENKAYIDPYLDWPEQCYTRIQAWLNISAGTGNYDGGRHGIYVDSNPGLFGWASQDIGLGYQTFSVIPDWPDVVIPHEMTNMFTGNGVTGAWPYDWWADGRSPFPAMTAVQVEKYYGHSYWQLHDAGDSQDSTYVMFKALQSTYGWPMFQKAFAAMIANQVDLSVIEPEYDNASWRALHYLRSHTVAYYLSRAAGVDLSSVLNSGGVGGYPPLGWNGCCGPSGTFYPYSINLTSVVPTAHIQSPTGTLKDIIRLNVTATDPDWQVSGVNFLWSTDGTNFTPLGYGQHGAGSAWFMDWGTNSTGVFSNATENFDEKSTLSSWWTKSSSNPSNMISGVSPDNYNSTPNAWFACEGTGSPAKFSKCGTGGDVNAGDYARASLSIKPTNPTGTITMYIKGTMEAASHYGYYQAYVNGIQCLSVDIAGVKDAWTRETCTFIGLIPGRVYTFYMQLYNVNSGGVNDDIWVDDMLFTNATVVGAPSYVAKSPVSKLLSNGVYKVWVAAVATDPSDFQSATSTSTPFLIDNTASSKTVNVTVRSNPAGSAFVQVDYANVTTPATFKWTVNSTHTISANSPLGCGTGCGYIFQSWSDGGAQSHTITASKTTTAYNATFVQQYYLTMQTSTGGSVSPKSGWYISGASVQIQATPSAGYAFASWAGSGSGSYSGTTATNKISITGAITESASFVPQSGTITITSNPTGSSYVTVDGAYFSTPATFTWQTGSKHTVSAVSQVSCGAGCQYAFQSWSDGGSQSHTITVQNKTVTYTAAFNLQYRLTLQGSPAGGGTVSSSATPSSGCGAGCYWYNYLTPIYLTATPNQTDIFTSWTGTGTGSYSGVSNPVVFILRAATAETAHFAQNPQPRILTLELEIQQFYMSGDITKISLEQSLYHKVDVTLTLVSAYTATTSGARQAQIAQYATSILNSFIIQVRSQRGKQISAAAADKLTVDALQILNSYPLS